MSWQWDDFSPDSLDNAVDEPEIVETQKPPDHPVDKPKIVEILEPPEKKRNANGGVQTSLFNWTISDKSKKVNKRVSRSKRSKSTEVPIIDIENGDFSSFSIKIEEPEVKIHHTLKIQDIKIEMPVKPYPCQVQVIESIISGCQNKANCLLESPTGSGKTLALLCGALGWQNDFQNKFEETQRQERDRQDSGSSRPPQAGTAGCCQSNNNCCDVNELDLDMFDAADWADLDPSDCSGRSDRKVPKIYYGSRTHKQIGQVVKELKKTVYRNKRMTVLSSREFTCIQETNRNKTELCGELLDPVKKMGCPYYNEHNKATLGSHLGLAQHGVQTPWDIEDLVSAGREEGACPYFAARALMVEAEIIFCPYNYIIDPAIRETLQLDIVGHIIILDEAHNMEDFCREAGSVSLTDSLLESIIADCTNILEFAAGKRKTEQAAYAAMIESYCVSLRKFIDTTVLNEQKGAYDAASSDQWTGTEILTVFEINGIKQATTRNFIRSAREAICLFNANKEDLRQGISSNLPVLTTDTIRKLEMILMALNATMSPEHAIDYRAVVKLTSLGFKKEKSLEFMCMNAGVVFSPISAMARSIILASGTLAPTTSFAGELGVKFPYTIQANHVTPQDQICIKCVSKGPNGKPLRATYQNVNTWDFQDQVGKILLTVCESVPHGILIFFSSYSVMTNLLNRWKSNNTMKQICATKHVFEETRGSGDLTAMMENYREVIKSTKNGPIGNFNGAVLFAVFRGKVAEGIDFSDEEARAVLTLGIPYPVRNDPSIDMKYKYNDTNRSKGLLGGYDWYNCQAFRALNQALGRAIRHQNDWGAIILIDERFLQEATVKNLPAWVRSMWSCKTGPQPELGKQLRDFVARQKRREKSNQVT